MTTSQNTENNDDLRLFGGDSLSGFLRARQAAAVSAVDKLAATDFLAAGPDALFDQLVAQWSVEPLVVHLDQMQREQFDIKISKMMDTRDYGKIVRREVFVPGYMMSYPIPFSGDPQLWLLNAGPWLEKQGTLDAQQRILTLNLRNYTDVESPWYQRQMDETMKRIDIHIEAQQSILKQYHLDLAQAVRLAVARRAKQIQPKP